MKIITQQLDLVSQKIEKIPDRVFFPLAAAAFASILISRRPSVVLNAQFWAEDGRNWFADAYNHGFIYSVMLPEAGYLQTFARLVAQLGQFVPLENAPLLFAISAIGVQVAVASFIVSRRMEVVCRARSVRLVFAFLYLAVPHSWETYANVTNSQWHLALLAFLVIISSIPNGLGARIFDLAIICISSLSGPLVIFLAPIAGYFWFVRKDRHRLIIFGLMVIGALIQTLTLLTSERPIQSDIGWGPLVLIEILGRHVFISPIIGSRGFNGIVKMGLWNSFTAILTVVSGTALLLFLVYRSNRELRALAVLCVLIVAAALYSPAVTMEPGQWSYLAALDTGLRYWLFPSLCIYLLVLRAAVFESSRPLRTCAAAILPLIAFGVFADWKHPKLPDLVFYKYATAFEAATPGTQVSIPINPGWEMKLIKKK